MYTASFKSLCGDQIKILIITPRETTVKELTLSGDQPVTIEYDQDEVFKPLKMSACSVKILTKEPLLDLFTGALNSVELYVYRGSTLLWYGLLTPNVYSSPYEDIYDELTLEFVDPISALENVKYKCQGGKVWRSFEDYILGALSKVPILNNYKIEYPNYIDIKNLGCLERNFVDETGDEDEAMTQREVIEEIMRYLRMQAVMVGNTLKIIRPASLRELPTSIEDVGLAKGSAKISLGSVYNRVTVVENTNPMDEILETNILDDDIMQSAMLNDGTYWDNDIKAYNVLLERNGKNYHDIRAMYRPKSDSGWTLVGTDTFYPLATAINISKDNVGALRPYKSIDKHMSFLSCMYDRNKASTSKGSFVCYDTSYPEDDVPSRLSFQKAICMYYDAKIFAKVESHPYIPDYYNIEPTTVVNIPDDERNVPYVTYYKPNNTVMLREGYLVLALKYQYLHTPMTKMLANYDYENKSEVRFLVDSGRVDSYTDYFYARLKIGNKYFNGTKWTETESKFMLPSTWQPTTALFCTEAKLDNTNTFRLRLGDKMEGLAIPINVELFGDVKFELFLPNFFGRKYQQGKTLHYTNCCMISELKLAYCIQKNDASSIVLDDDTEDNDIKISGQIDAENIFDMDDIEMKVNTWSNLENSYSYVIRKTGDELSYEVPEVIPEKDVIERYINYYSEPRLQFECTLNDGRTVHISPTQQFTIPAFSGRIFTTGRIFYDLANNSADVTLLEIKKQ